MAKQGKDKAENVTNEVPQLTAKNLKSVLWETLNMVKNGSMDAGQADSIASTAREIIRTTNTQLKIANQSARQVPTDLIDFSEK